MWSKAVELKSWEVIIKALADMYFILSNRKISSQNFLKTQLVNQQYMG